MPHVIHRFTQGLACRSGFVAAMLASSCLPSAFGRGDPVCCTSFARLNEIRTDHPGAIDPQEYVEIAGPAGSPLNCIHYVVLGPGGLVEEVTDLTGFGIPGSGIFLIAQPSFAAPAFPGTPVVDLVTDLNLVDGGNRTHLLVCSCEGLAGMPIGTDLDPDDDGFLEIVPWECVIDCIALMQTPPPPPVYCDLTRGPTTAATTPEHVFRCRTPLPFAPWRIGNFPLPGGGGLDSPDLQNPFCPTVTAFGIDHMPLGEAELSFDGSTLLAMGVDASGEDGVLSLLEPSVTWYGRHFTPAGRAGVEPGDSVRVRTWGMVDGELAPIAAHTLSRPTETVAEMTADFDILPPNAPLVGEVLDDDVIVGSVTFPDQASFLAQFPASPMLTWREIEWIYRSTIDTGPIAEANNGLPVALPSWEMPMDSDMPIILLGQMFIGDSIRVRASQPVAGIEAITAIETTAAGFGFETLETRAETTTTGVVFESLPHVAIGGASLTHNGSSVAVANLGSSGDAGFEVILGAADAWTTDLVSGGASGESNLKVEALDAQGTPQFSLVAVPSQGKSKFFANLPGSGPLVVEAWEEGNPNYVVALIPDSSPFAEYFDVEPKLWFTPQRVGFDHTPSIIPVDESGTAMSEPAILFGVDAPPIGFILGDGQIVGANRIRVHRVFGTQAPSDAPASSASVRVTASQPATFSIVASTAEGALTPPTPCPADLTGDGSVGGGDLAILLGDWDPIGPSSSIADVSGDGRVDAADLAIMLGAWGPCPS